MDEEGLDNQPLFLSFFSSFWSYLNMHRFKSQGVSSRVFSKPQWVNPKDRVTKWNIVTGDKVNILLLAYMWH